MSSVPRFALVALAWFCGTGCVNDQLSFFIEGFAAYSGSDGTCSLSSLSGGTYPSQNLFDVGIVEDAVLDNDVAIEGYHVAPSVKNGIVPPTTTVGSVADTNSITLAGFDIELIPDPRDTEVSTALPLDRRKFRVPTVQKRITPGSSVAQFLLAIDRGNARLLAAGIKTEGIRIGPPLLVRIRPVGDRAGQVIIGGYSDYYIYPCKHCLVHNLGSCADGFPASSIQVGGCFAEQDFPLDCCTESTGKRLCGKDVPTMASGGSG